MKRMIIILFHAVLVINGAFAQLVADAGGDKHFCTYPDSLNQLIIGGEPTAYGGVEPYAFEWSMEPFDLYPGSSITIITSHVLDDSTSANPNVIDFTLRESFKFKLKVTDDIGKIAYDSCVVSFSAFAKTLLYYGYVIPHGDSIFLTKDVNIGRLFNEENITYEWTPSESLSDANLKTDFWAKPDTTTWYSVKIIDEFGCEAQGDPYYHIVVQTLGVDQNNLLELSIYPNPTSNEIYIDSEAILVDKIEVSNLIGEVLILEEAHHISKVNIGILSQGMYLVNLFSNGKLIHSSKILRE